MVTQAAHGQCMFCYCKDLMHLNGFFISSKMSPNCTRLGEDYHPWDDNLCHTTSFNCLPLRISGGRGACTLVAGPGKSISGNMWPSLQVMLVLIRAVNST